ncbi:hypothetical protein SHKM778_00840 [Streptomyces sp. KM77-8]|uniref:Lipoyl-binding domain-containing protein n=1 Tax=Streptomyces haneummycinicus TaxID=3074435 RepID=A0AAT9H8J3_9ACTN
MTTMTNASVREFKMPDVGEGLTEAEILKWYVQPGDTVTDGQVVCEVETAKAAVELPIPYDGVVRALHFPEGTTVDVGTSIIAVDVSGGAAPVAEEEAPAPLPPRSPPRSRPSPRSSRRPASRSWSATAWRRPRRAAVPARRPRKRQPSRS